MHKSHKQIFITGIAGFIGFHLALKLNKRGYFVSGIDNFNNYYDISLKRKRADLLREKNILVMDGDISNRELLENTLLENKSTHLVHLAAQAGVRYSITHPEVYQETNSNGFFHILEILRKHPTIKLIFASSSSVYGLNKKIPFSETDPTDSPANFYGATKKSNELMAFSYHNLYGISAIGLRFFTVYGPWGRPDMAYFSFSQAIKEGKTIKLFNQGKMQRDFTYIDDIVEGICAALELGTGFDIFNLGNNSPEELMKMVNIIENRLGKKAKLELLPMPIGEIQTTYADIAKAKKVLGFSPKTSLETGMEKFLSWFVENN